MCIGASEWILFYQFSQTTILNRKFLASLRAAFWGEFKVVENSITVLYFFGGRARWLLYNVGFETSLLELLVV